METGVDIVKNSRIKNILDKNRESLYKRIFTDNEVEYISSKNHDYKTVSGLFAAKEAVSKMLGTGIGAIGWKDIEILHNNKNKPYVYISPKMSEMLELLNINSIELSISHEEEFAIAFVIGYMSEKKIFVPKEIKEILPRRNVDAHKGSYGRVGIIGGSKGMTGAPYLASTAALKSGSGLVYSVVPKDIEDIMSIKFTEVIVNGYESIDQCLSIINKMDGLVLGPGLGESSEIKALVKAVLETFKGPIVLDADGINAIDDERLLLNRKGLTVITPHPGELSRLINKDIKEIQEQRIFYSKYTSEKYNVITVLKGHETIVTYKNNTYINKTGNPGMATAGSGDVLSGMIISFICQGIDPYKSCILATYIHGLSGDLGKMNLGEYGLVASDILDLIPMAIKKIQI